MTWEPCACGGVILAPEVGETLEGVILAHQDTPRHLKWRIAQLEALVAELVTPPPTMNREGRIYE